MNKIDLDQEETIGETPQDLRSQRIALLLSEIWREGHISRSRLAKITGLALPSVTRLVQELKSSGLIIETEKGKSSGGRQPLLIQVNPSAGLVIGLDLSGVELRGAILDAAHQSLVSITQPFQGRNAEAVTDQIIQVCRSLLSEPLAQSGRVLGIGVSVPGMVDHKQGIIRDALNLNLYDYPIRDILQEALGLPVFIEHDTSAAALAEMSFGAACGVKDLIYITVSTGIGAGLVINNRIYRGQSDLAGELGHVIVERGGQICTGGKSGCLEAVAAVPAMLSNLHSVLYRQTDLTTNPSGNGINPVGLETLIRAATAGEYMAQEIIHRAATYLAMAISMMASILDIRLIIIGGEVIQMGDLYFAPLQAAMQKYHPDGPPIRIVPSQLGENACLKGVGVIALQNCLVP